jgi:adenylate kinase
MGYEKAYYQNNSCNAMIYIFLGPPASGKGTQAELLAKALHIPFISIGSKLREAANKNPDLAQALHQGELAPESVVKPLLIQLHADYPESIILDGAIRSPEQVAFVTKLWGKENIVIIWIDIADATIRERATHRIARDGHKRPDDALAIVENRISQYRQILPMLMASLQESDLRTISIDGSPDPDTIHQEIKKTIDL